MVFNGARNHVQEISQIHCSTSEVGLEQKESKSVQTGEGAVLVVENKTE